MSYDIDSERYSVHPETDGTWTIIDEYYDEDILTFATAEEAEAHCRDMNDNYNEEIGMRAIERAFELYWGGY